MKIALRITALSLFVALAATASARLPIPAAHPCQANATATVSDPDPADCPFCGGNPALHIRLLVGLERTSMALFAHLTR